MERVIVFFLPFPDRKKVVDEEEEEEKGRKMSREKKN